MSALPSRIGEHHDAAVVRSRAGSGSGPSVSLISAIWRAGIQPDGVSIRRSPSPCVVRTRVRQPHHHIEAAIAVDDARHHAAVRQPADLIDHRRRLHAVERGARIIDPDFELRNADLLLDLHVGRGRELRQACRASSSAVLRMVSRSSPKIFSAISARMPDSMWSSRCAIGWPTLTDSGSTPSSRPDIGDDLGLRPRRRIEIDFEFADMDAFGMLVEFGAAGAAADRLHLRHLPGSACSAMVPTRLDSASDTPGIELDQDIEGALVERRQERARQREGRAPAATDHADKRDAENEPARCHRPRASAAPYQRFSTRTRQLSCSSRLFRPGSM